MNYTDKQLKTALEMMMPDLIFYCGDLYIYDTEFGAGGHRQVLDTELLHICWLVEGTLSANETEIYEEIFQRELCVYAAIHASWQQRVIALAEVKTIKI